MAIEFHCPYCTAVMRVADQFAGRPGRCPKCDSVVIVPDVRPPVLTSAEDQPVSEQATQVRSSKPFSPAVPSEDSAADSGLSFVAPPTRTSIARSLKKRRGRHRTRRVWLVGIPVICFLLLLGAIGWYVVTRLPALSGEIPAMIYSDNELPPVIISWSSAVDLTADQQATLQSELQMVPESFLSSQMTCRMNGVEDGIQVQLKTTDETNWYVVNANASPALVLWLRKNRDGLTAARNLKFQAAFQDYCRQKLLVLAGQAPSLDARRFRDSVGLEACCSGFGSVIEAVVHNRVVRCAYEDGTGRLFFCLPRGIVNFVLRGKTLADGSKPFAGEFQIRVTGTIPSPETEPSPPADGDEDVTSDTESTEIESTPESTSPPDMATPQSTSDDSPQT
jgi:hypothetical protein